MKILNVATSRTLRMPAWIVAAAGLSLSSVSPTLLAAEGASKVTPVPEPVRQEWGLSPFYKKYVSAGGLPVLASEKVSDYALVEEVFGDRPWRYTRPTERTDLAHLEGFDRSRLPEFSWPRELLEWNRRNAAEVERNRRARRESRRSREERVSTTPEENANPRVLIQTELGDLEVELFFQEAPATVANFLRYVRAGFFEGGSFFRTVTPDNQPTDPVKIQVIQAEANREKRDEFFPPIPLERTRDTGVKHLDGTLSMARSEPDTARHSFSICIGDQPELDFGGKRNPDGQGFAAFGKVIQGMDVARRIHASSREGQKLTPPIRIQGAELLNGEETK